MTTAPPRPIGRSIVKAVLILLTLIVGVLLPARHLFLGVQRSSGESAYVVSCSSHLKQLGQAIWLYAEKHRGAYPPTIDAAVAGSALQASTLGCPALTRRRDDSIAALFGMPPALPVSYLYLADRVTTRASDAQTILAIERDGNHDSGVNVLFGDGHAEFLHHRSRQQDAPWWTNVQAQIARGDRPVQMP